jgi:hypothetical protein
MPMDNSTIHELEGTLAKTFEYDDNDPATYSNAKCFADVVRQYLSHPAVQGKRKSEQRL